MTFDPPSECDLVLKGGITSGVVYPTLIAKLAGRLRIRSLGGTSAGAIAAVVAAAAQYAKNGGAQDAFKVLEEIPDWLKTRVDGQTNLYHLFQPSRALAPHLRTLQAILEGRSWAARAWRTVSAGIMNFWLGGLAGFVPGALIAWFSWQDQLSGWFIAGAAGAALIGLVVGILLQLVVTLLVMMPGNGYGICTGLRSKRSQHAALTEWLHDLVQRAAGQSGGDPLTFGDLDAQPEAIRVTLATITSSISLGQAQRLPFDDSQTWFFRKDEMQALFPPDVVAWLVAHPHPGMARESADVTKAMADAQLFALPARKDFPILLAARMSLSFPVLLSAVPLWKVRVDKSETGAAIVRPRRVLFTDGGNTSNFPFHFFDTLFPLRPTFGVFLRDDLPEGADVSRRVYLPKSNLGGINPAYYPIPDRGLRGSIGFFVGLVKTMKDWRDNALRVAPGYRDRVVHVRHTKKEGGLNLNMPVEAIERMRDSGTLAAERLIAEFVDAPPAKNRWLNHRWVRARSSLGLLCTLAEEIDRSMAATQQPPYLDMVRQGTTHGPPSSYRFQRKAQAVAAENVMSSLAQLAAGCRTSDVTEGVPKPTPSLAVTPRT